MNERKWPYPGDSPVARARRVAQAYRAIAEAVDPDACADLDARLYQWGETWAVPTLVTVDPDDWLTPGDAANLAGVSVGQLRVWRKRGRIVGRPNGNSYQYRAGDIQQLFTAVRRRNRGAAVTLSPHGTRVPAERNEGGVSRPG